MPQILRLHFGPEARKSVSSHFPTPLSSLSCELLTVYYYPPSFFPSFYWAWRRAEDPLGLQPAASLERGRCCVGGLARCCHQAAGCYAECSLLIAAPRLSQYTALGLPRAVSAAWSVQLFVLAVSARWLNGLGLPVGRVRCGGCLPWLPRISHFIRICITAHVLSQY